MDEPQYRVWLEEPVPPKPFYDTRPGRWVAEPRWPSPNIKPQTLHLNAGGRLDPSPAPENAGRRRSPPSLGETCGAWCGFRDRPGKTHRPAARRWPLNLFRQRAAERAVGDPGRADPFIGSDSRPALGFRCRSG